MCVCVAVIWMCEYVKRADAGDGGKYVSSNGQVR